MSCRVDSKIIQSCSPWRPVVAFYCKSDICLEFPGVIFLFLNEFVMPVKRLAYNLVSCVTFVICQMLWSAQLGHVGRSKQMKASGPSQWHRNEWSAALFPEGEEKLGLCLLETVKIQFNSAHTEIKLYCWLQNVLACDGWIPSLFSPTMLCTLGTTISGIG